MERLSDRGCAVSLIGALLLVITLGVGFVIAWISGGYVHSTGAFHAAGPAIVVAIEILAWGGAGLFFLGLLLFAIAEAGKRMAAGGAGGGPAAPGTSGSLTERIQRAGMTVTWVNADGCIYHMASSAPIGRVTASGAVRLDMGPTGQVRSDGVVVRDGMGPVLTVHPDGTVTTGGAYFATAQPAMNRIHAGAGALALLIYAAAA